MDAVMSSVLWFAAAAVVLVNADMCSRKPWNDTICCTGGRPNQEGEVRVGAENALSVLACETGPSSSGLNATLHWSYAEMPSIDGYSFERIYLFSKCIDPTHTSLHSLNTLLYDSNMHHHAFSTIVSQPQNSQCSYFGCYGAFHGFYYYTFSEVSCTMHDVVPTGTDYIYKTLRQPQPSAYMQSKSADLAEQYIHSAVTPSPLHTSLAKTHGVIGHWQSMWYIFLLLAVLLTLCVSSLCLVIIRHNSTRRNSSHDVREGYWTSQLWIGISLKDDKHRDIDKVDKLSLHSVHTVYEELTQVSTYGNGYI